VFRRSFREIKGHYCMGQSCIFCALDFIFKQFQYSSNDALPPDGLRVALAVAFKVSIIEYTHCFYVYCKLLLISPGLIYNFVMVLSGFGWADKWKGLFLGRKELKGTFISLSSLV